MSRTMLIVGVLGASLVLPGIPADAAKKRCGSVGSGMDRLVVRIESGPAGCREAMKVARLVSAGSMRVGKWRCDGGAGGIGCTKPRPRARITMLVA
jgi:hypothetical protein